jgi:hypothetical protein
MEEHAPAGMPSGNGKYIAVAAVLLLGIGGILVWKFAIDKPSVAPVASTAPPPVDSAAEDRKRKQEEKDIVPPRPPEPEPEPIVSAPVATLSGARPKWTGGGPAAPAPDDCSKCDGSGGPNLAAAVRARTGMAQSCYQKALQSDSTLKGHVAGSVRVSATGRTCGASANGDIGGGVAQCVANIMRSGSYPPATGGCVDVAFSLNFVPR